MQRQPPWILGVAGDCGVCHLLKGLAANCLVFRVCKSVCIYPRAPSYLNSKLLAYVTIGYIEPRTHYLGNWSPKVYIYIW